MVINIYWKYLLQNEATLGTGVGLVLHASVRFLQKYLSNESISGLVYRYSATSVSEYPITCKFQIGKSSLLNIREQRIIEYLEATEEAKSRSSQLASVDVSPLNF